MKKGKLSIVIPVYNEKNYIIDILKEIKDLKIKNIDKQIIVVDDCSSDGTKEILKNSGKKYADIILFQDKNTGKGGAVQKGIKASDGDVIIIKDADKEYVTSEIENVVMPIFNDECDVCYGSRFLNLKMKGYLPNRVANKYLTKFSNIFTKFNATDMETCYKACKGDILRSIDLKEKRFGFDPEVTLKLSKRKVRFKEVAISYYPRTKKEGKKIRLKDGFRSLHCILKYK